MSLREKSAIAEQATASNGESPLLVAEVSDVIDEKIKEAIHPRVTDLRVSERRLRHHHRQ